MPPCTSSFSDHEPLVGRYRNNYFRVCTSRSSIQMVVLYPAYSERGNENSSWNWNHHPSAKLSSVNWSWLNIELDFKWILFHCSIDIRIGLEIPQSAIENLVIYNVLSWRARKRVSIELERSQWVIEARMRGWASGPFIERVGLSWFVDGFLRS